MKTKFILFFLLFACTIQAQTIHLRADSYRYKYKDHDVALWSKWIYSYDEITGITWDYTHNTLNVKDNQDFTFNLIPLNPYTKTINMGRDVIKRYYYEGEDWDELPMSVTIDNLGDHNYRILIIRKHLVVEYFCKEVKAQ
jgi:hypothetical protein